MNPIRLLFGAAAAAISIAPVYAARTVRAVAVITMPVTASATPFRFPGGRFPGARPVRPGAERPGSERQGSGRPGGPGQPAGNRGPGERQFTPAQIAAFQRRMAGGFADYMYCDPASHRLYVGFTSQGSLVVINTRTNRVTANISNLPGCHTVAVVPSLHLGFTSDGREDKVGVIDLRTNRLLRKLPGGQGPDAIIYDPAARLVYVANHSGQAATLIDPVRQTVVATIPLGGTAEYPQADPVTGRVYQNLESTSEVVVVEPHRRAVVARYKLGSGEGPSGLALDAAHHRLFAACGNQKLVVLDSRNGHIIQTLPIGAGVDFAQYDRALRRVYTANGESGNMTVIHEDTPDHYTVLEDAPTHEGGHALAVDTWTHRVYVVYGHQVAVYAAIPTSRS